MSRLSRKLAAGETFKDAEQRAERKRQRILAQESVRGRAYGNQQQHCQGKSPLVEARAIRIAMRQQTEGSVNSRAYECGSCSRRLGWQVWHVGHKQRADHTVFDRRGQRST